MGEKINITEREVAAVYGLGIRQLRLMRLRGTGPRWIKVSGEIGRSGGRILYPREAVETWLLSRPSGGELMAPAKAGT